MWTVPRIAWPTVPWWASQSLAVAVHEAVALGAGVVLVDDRPEPVDHLRLHLGRARRGGVHDDLERRQVVARRAPPSGSLSMRMNIVGTTWLKVTWCSSHEREVLLRVEVLHHDDGAAEPVRGAAEAQRRGVVQRARGRGRRVDSSAPNRQLRQPGDAVGALAERCVRAAAPSRPWAGRWCRSCRACPGPRPGPRRAGVAGWAAMASS